MWDWEWVGGDEGGIGGATWFIVLELLSEIEFAYFTGEIPVFCIRFGYNFGWGDGYRGGLLYYGITVVVLLSLPQAKHEKNEDIFVLIIKLMNKINSSSSNITMCDYLYKL